MSTSLKEIDGYLKTTNIILAILFLLFAVVQYNDPDPWGWIGLYSFVALISAFAAFGRYYKWLTLGGLVICLIWMITLAPDFINWINMGMPSIVESMKAEKPHIELTREFLGLLIAGGTLAFHYYRSGRKNKQL